MPDGIVLSEQDRARLDGIVQKMIANKESDENIKFVVEDFKNKYGLKKKEPTASSGQTEPKASTTKTQATSTSSDTEQPTRAQASVGSGGPTKTFRLAGESDLETMQKRGILPPPSSYPRTKVDTNNLYGSKSNFNKDYEELKAYLGEGNYKQRLETLPKDKKTKKAEDLYTLKQNSTEHVDSINEIANLKKKIQETDSELENPYVYYSVQKQKENPDNFLNENYNTKELLDLGINLEDFDGFLNKKGYKYDFIKKKSKGFFEGEGKSLEGYDIDLAEELSKKRMLDLYIEDKYNRDFIKQDLNQDILIASGDIKEKSIQKNQLFDQKKILSYIEKHFPVLTKKLKERDEENAKLYEEAKKGGTDFFSWDTVSKIGKAGWNSLTDRINQFTASGYDILGAEDTAEGIRMLDEQEKLLRPNDRGVSYVSGKKINDNGVNYIVDSKGDIYDADSKIIVTDLFNEQKYKNLVEKSKYGEDDWIFSTQGAAVQTSAVVTDMLFQAALTKGIGTGGSIASEARGLFSGVRGTSKVASVLNDTSKILRTIPIDRSTGYSMIAQGALGYSQGYEDTLKAAREAGINDKDAFELAANAGQRMALLYSTTGVINPQTNVVENVFGSKNIIKKAIEQYTKTGKKGFVGYIDDLIKNTPRNLVDFAEEGGKEVIQENIQQVGELGVNKITNLDAGKKIMNEVMSADDFMNTSILSFISSGLISKAKMPTLFRSDSKDDLKSLSVLSKNRDKVDGVLNDLLSKQVFTKEQVDNLKQDVDIYTRNVGKLPKKISADIAMPIMRELDKINKLNEEKKNVDKVFHDDIDNQISSIENNIKELYKSKETSEVKEMSVKPAAEVEQKNMDEFYKIHEESYSIRDKAGEDLRSDKITADEYNSILQNEESKTAKKLNELKDRIGDNEYDIVTKNADINWYENAIEGSEKTIKEIENKKNPTEEDLKYKKREEEYLERNKQGFLKAKEELQSLKEKRNKQPKPTEVKVEEVKPTIESPIELKEGEELVDVKQDKKGNTYTYVAETSEKDGVKTTKFKFNRSDKSSEQRNSTGVDADKVLDKYGYEIPADEIPEGAEIIEINEIREGEKTTGATVTFKDAETGNRYKREIVLQPKAKEAKPEVKAEKAKTAPKNRQERIDAAAKDDMVYHDLFGTTIESTREQYKAALKEIAETGAIEDIGKYGKEISKRQAPPIEFQRSSLLNINQEDAKALLDEFETKEAAPKEELKTATEEIAPSEIETTLDEVIVPASKDIKEQISRAKRAISKFLPNVEIVYHTTAESFQSAVGDNSRGYYDPNTKKIHINGSNAINTTVAHEVFHALILKNISSNKQATDLTNKMFKALVKSLKGNPKLLKEITEFSKRYEKREQSEEKLAEVIGYLASEYETLPDVSKNIIQKWIEKIAKMLGIKKFTDQEVVDFMNAIATKVSTGQEITETDVKAINQGVSTYIAEPTEINRYQKVKEEKVKVGDHKLSFVKQSDIINFDSLLKDISDKKQKVWFWVADQLGRGNYYDSVIDGEHYLDAGPSFALDPENRSKNVIWATGKPEKEITKLINSSDYIFIISGSPLKSKLFNKSIIDIISKRAGDFNSFKENILRVSKIKPLNDVLSSVNSWEQLRDTPKRKEFLLNVLNQSDKNTPLKKELEKYNAIVDLNELRDGFYADNNFDINDIMLVLKPTGFGGKSNHSTYENDILGEVVGVPDIKVDAFDIMPSEIKDKYKKDLTKSMKQQVVAPYGIGVKPIERKEESVKGRKQISPENSSNYAHMTEDGKGNFVFYHYGPRGIESIDPKKYGSNKGAITSKPEIAAMGRVGGMSQYYTKPEYSEHNVTGDKYMIKVPMSKVYDFNTDPENFIQKAKEIFKRRHPDLPFTANDQLAHITKLAEKAGYYMTVAEWNNMSRAQSTKPLKPVDVQVMDGNVITKPFKENYESNSTKGFVSVVPTSKEAKLKDVYEKINAERNAENRYDSLYSLAEDFPKLSQDEITAMIEKSDISKEMKDAYAEALAYEPGARMSGRRQINTDEISNNTKAEVDSLKKLPLKEENGATFNLDGTKYEGGGLVVPVKSLEGNTNQDKISPEMIADFAKNNEDKIGDDEIVKLGIYKFPDSDTVSIDMNIVIPNEHRDVALEFGKLIGQESLFDLDTFENIKTGADGLNPMNLTAEQFREAAASLKNGVMPASVSGRRQLSPIDEAVKVAKNKGFNDKDIADYLVGKGYTRAQATKAILRYNEFTAVKLRKEDSVFTKEGRNKIVTFLDQVKRRAFSARSFLPKSVFLQREKIESNIKAEAKRASYLVDDFNRLVKKYKGNVDELNKEFDKYLRGDQTANLPDEFKAVAGKMRMHIDNLSQMLLRTGAVSVSQAETIAANLGQYINRSYQVFDKKNWAKQVTEEMKEAARVDLRNMYRAEAESKAKQTGMDADIILEDFINKKIDELISGESAATFLGVGKTGAKNLGIMKQRLDIPLSIRQLMGEYKDASQNYARTVLKIATLAENARFLQSAREAGMGVFFYNENDPNRPKEFNTKIAGDKSDTMSPLNGLYTTPEIAKAFTQKIGTGDAIEAALGTEFGPIVKSMYETYMKALSSVKWLKTIGSVATHAKNVTGNIWFMLSNGYYNPKKYAEAFKVLKNSSNEQLRDKLDEYIRAGIIDQSAALGEIKAMFSDADFETAIDSRLKKNPFQKVKAGVKKLGQKMSTAYQLEDDFFKIISYESEKNRYANAYFDKSFDELTNDQKDIVKNYASEITKNILPNYSRIPGLVKLLKAVPVTGTFVSFQAEAYRTAWNTVALAADELKSDNKKVRAIGAKRLAGIAASQAAKLGLMALMGTIVSGGGDDDDDDLKKNTKLFIAPWSKDSDIVLVDYGNGKMSYIDFSASDPHGGIKKAYNSVMSGKSVAESFANGLTQLLEPFMKEDMLLNVITDIKDNKNSYGGKLYNESDTDVNKINAIMDRVYKAFEPGTITSIRKIVGSDDVRNELMGQLTGYKINTVDVNKQLGFKMNELKDLSGEAKKLYSSAFYKFEDGVITGDELDKIYNQANKSQKEVYKKMIDYMNAASFFGVEDYLIEDNMQGVGKSVINDLWYGDTPDMKMKEPEE